jgi:hypothetical protein
MGSFSTLVAAAVLGLTPANDVAHDVVDLIEVNHFYDEHGRLVFDQVIFYDWCCSQTRYQVRAWRLLKNPAQVPTRNFSTGEYETIWHDGDVLRRVRAGSFRESWTQHDPELREREYLPKDRRRELYRTRVVSQSTPQ